MPFLTTTLRGVPGSGSDDETIRTLHTELEATGFPVEAEAGRHLANDLLRARVEEFQTWYQLPVTGEVDPTTGGVLTLASIVATIADPTVLRTALRNARNRVPNSPLYNHWLARYALLAGDHSLAGEVRPGGPVGSLPTLDPILDGGEDHRSPEVPFPENYYTYLHDLMAPTVIEQLHSVESPTGLRPEADDTANLRPRDDEDPVPEPEPEPPRPPPPPAPGNPQEALRQRRIRSALAWLGAVEWWQAGHEHMKRQRYAGAVAAFETCQSKAFEYFRIYYAYAIAGTTVPEQLESFVAEINDRRPHRIKMWPQLNARITAFTIDSLRGMDWTQISSYHGTYITLKANLKGDEPPNGQLDPAFRELLMDVRMLIMAAVLVPLARGEANRQRRQYEAARSEMKLAIKPYSLKTPNGSVFTTPLANTLIEVPFVRLLLCETLLDQAEAAYKAQTSIDDEPDEATRTAQLERLNLMAADLTARHIPGAGPGVPRFGHLVAALLFQDVLDHWNTSGKYVERTMAALNVLQARVKTAVDVGDVTSRDFHTLGNTVTVPTIAGLTPAPPGLNHGANPHEQYVWFRPLTGEEIVAERNPRVYGILLTAQARLLQIWSGFNYLGYRDDYVPPWRFHYLLDRARYFAEHARNAQRDYLNFLEHAEQEEFRELGAAQTAELEKANVQIESARVAQAQKEVAASQQSTELADLTAQNAQTRLTNYLEFDQDMSGLVSKLYDSTTSMLPDVIESTVTEIVSLIPGFGGVAAASQRKRERQLEKKNLRLAVAEANQARNVAAARLEVAKSGLVVAGLQRQAALLRHEFALQNLAFLRNRTLNTEQWYRLAAAIRSVGETYLRYGIESAFLTQQAYNFEADRRLNVIRFDYDMSDVGAMLAADFLLRDLDGLEQDLVVGQQVREQQVRYVISLAQEFPDALRSLADAGEATFSLRLEQLERHFPGLLNLRIASVELQPLALMNPSRVSIQLRQLGAGMIRLKAQPGTSPLNVGDVGNSDWLPGAAAWPVKISLSAPETAVFSGLSSREATGLIRANERVAFEGLAGASSWQIDMSMAENQVVPETLADIVVSFTLTGQFDRELESVVRNAGRTNLAATRLVSARTELPDAYEGLVQAGTLAWDITPRMLELTARPNALRNVAVAVPPRTDGAQLGRSYCRYPVEIDISMTTGALTIVSLLPELALASNGLTLVCQYTGAGDATWDFGDGSALVPGNQSAHAYREPGRYDVLVRIVRDGRLSEYTLAVIVSATHTVTAPLIAWPIISLATPVPATGPVDLQIRFANAVSGVALNCAIGSARSHATTGPVKLTGIPRDRVTLDFFAIRDLPARIFNRQRYAPDTLVRLERSHIATNRTFAENDTETTNAPNAFTRHIFGPNPAQSAVSPLDRWSLQLAVADNPWFASVNAADQLEFDGRELGDALLSLEYTSVVRG